MKHIIEALKLIREKEIKGKEDNPKIIQLFNDLGYDGSKLKDETAWCAAFVNAILKRSGLPYTTKLNARSFLDYGEATNEPEMGDIVVFSRPPVKWQGHVAFFLREEGHLIYVLGGNQRDQVKVSAYPKSRFLSYRKVNYEN